MSTGAEKEAMDAAGLDRRRRLASAGFVALLLLSVFWPAPVLTVNDLCCDAALPVDELSFLGREAPSWDVAFWCLAGLFVIAMLRSGAAGPAEYAEPWRVLRAVRVSAPRWSWAIAAGGAVAVALVWRFADTAVTEWAERIQSDAIEHAIRIVNRFGGGMNPAMIALFFALGGVVYRRRLWIETAVAMALAGLGGGILAQLVKAVVGRARPELWLGPFAQARSSATSFPSGHTVGAFALGGVLLFGSRSLSLRVTAMLLATAVGLSRILAFRHWTSDVLASAVIGLLAAAVAVRSVIRLTNGAERQP
jgi:membrane-associated phospholipid phosphatase